MVADFVKIDFSFVQRMSEQSPLGLDVPYCLQESSCHFAYLEDRVYFAFLPSSLPDLEAELAFWQYYAPKREDTEKRYWLKN